LTHITEEIQLFKMVNIEQLYRYFFTSKLIPGYIKSCMQITSTQYKD